MEQRWRQDCISWVNRVPWNRYKEALDADGEVPENLSVEAGPVKVGGDRGVFIETRGKVPREFCIKKEDLEEHESTRGCGGCSSVFRGLARQPHNEQCRARRREVFKEGAEVRNAEESKQEFEKKE